MCVFRFQNDVKNAVKQTDWDDPLDGTGRSGMTIDTTKLNVAGIQYQYLGAGAIAFLMEDESTGYLVEFHRILYANKNTVPSSYSPSFHFFISVDNKATTSNMIAKCSSYAYFTE